MSSFIKYCDHRATVANACATAHAHGLHPVPGVLFCVAQHSTPRCPHSDCLCLSHSLSLTLASVLRAHSTRLPGNIMAFLGHTGLHCRGWLSCSIASFGALHPFLLHMRVRDRARAHGLGRWCSGNRKPVSLWGVACMGQLQILVRDVLSTCWARGCGLPIHCFA